MSDPTSRVLVKDGKWLVPPDQRPANWRAILPEAEAEPPAAPDPDPLEIAIQNTEAFEVAVRTADLCGCGKPVAHVGMCKVRAAKAVRTAGRNKSWKEISRAIKESARAYGPTEVEIASGMILAAGMYTQEPSEIRRMLLTAGMKDHARLVASTARRLLEVGLWSQDGVNMGTECPEMPDLGFWLNAMVAAGELIVDLSGDEPSYRGTP